MTIPKQFHDCQKQLKFRGTQPMVCAYKLLDLDSEKKNDVIVDVRCFWPNHSESCSAVVWVHDQKGNRYGYGVGKTTGYGYDHESAAIMAAMMDMGIIFESKESFDGYGPAAQEEAIKNLGTALGYENTLLVDFHP
jgi:hypothetical protein